VLDALGLRRAGDVDLVLASELFISLSGTPDWSRSTKHDEPILVHDDTEAFMSWGNDAVPNFEELYRDGITVGGVRFANPQFVIDWKRQRLSDKDKADILLLEGYLGRE
jgi:hypothetical protein